MLTKLPAQKGFTLIELMIAISLVGLLLLYMFSLYGREIKNQQLVDGRDQTTQKTVNTINQVVTQIRQQNVALSAANNSLIDANNITLIGNGGILINYVPAAQSILDVKSNTVLADHVQSFTITEDTTHPPNYHLFSIRLIVQKGSDPPYEIDTKVFKTDPH